MENEHIKTWTIQTETAWNIFQKDGELRGDGRRIWKEFRSAYRWIMEQMRSRVPGYNGGWPVWLWLQWNDTQKRPDLRHKAHLPVGQRGVRLELSVPAKEILPHDFELWHYVLWDEYLPKTEDEDLLWEKQSLHKPPNVARHEKQRSWEYIFDTVETKALSVAAVIEKLRLDHVRAVQGFVAR